MAGSLAAGGQELFTAEGEGQIGVGTGGNGAGEIHLCPEFAAEFIFIESDEGGLGIGFDGGDGEVTRQLIEIEVGRVGQQGLGREQGMCGCFLHDWVLRCGQV